jgi:hypothetical protein
MEKLTRFFDTEKENINEETLKSFLQEERYKLIDELFENGSVEQIIEHQDENGWRVRTKFKTKL